MIIRMVKMLSLVIPQMS